MLSKRHEGHPQPLREGRCQSDEIACLFVRLAD